MNFTPVKQGSPYSYSKECSLSSWRFEDKGQCFQPDHRRRLRLSEFKAVLPYFRVGRKVLEIGAGAGWQAKALSEFGLEVVAIDLVSSKYTKLREFPVIDYDGYHIPCPDESMDIVFSSNVLEHVLHIQEFQKEMMRVLRKDGLAIHILPTFSWRVWTTLSFYLRRVRVLGQRLDTRSEQGQITEKKRRKISFKRSPCKFLQWLFVPPVHGVRGDIVTEGYYFSERFWRKVFLSDGWRLESVIPAGLFYTGNKIMGDALSFRIRRILARLLGSSCKVYVMRKGVREQHIFSKSLERTDHNNNRSSLDSSLHVV